MKILVVSDTHGHDENLMRALQRELPIDALIHCGDLEGSEEYIPEAVECPCYFVRGNNDFFSYLPAEEEFWIGKKKVFITHGHSYYVSMETEQIREEGAARNADIIMFGHTHRPYFEERDGITVLNPGSLSFPRQEGRRGSYMILETDGEEIYEFKQYFL